MDPFKAIGDYFSAKEQGKALRRASKTEADASDRAVASTERINAAKLAAYERDRQDMLPFRKAGQRGMSYLESLVSGPIEESPLYKWRIAQGKKQINQSLAARGQYNSGAGLQLLSDFYNRTGAQETDKRFNRLAQFTALGEGVASPQYPSVQNPANTYMQTGTNQANLQIAQGQNRAGLYSNWGKNISDTTKQATEYLPLLLA